MTPAHRAAASALLKHRWAVRDPSLLTGGGAIKPIVWNDVLDDTLREMCSREPGVSWQVISEEMGITIEPIQQRARVLEIVKTVCAKPGRPKRVI